MERKFRCIKAYNDAFGNRYNEGEIVIGIKTITDKFYTLERDSKFVCQSTSIQGRNWQEITEPRIELKCVGFEEGQEFWLMSMYSEKHTCGVFRINKGKLEAKWTPNEQWGEVINIVIFDLIKGEYEVVLIPQTTEEDKQIAELKETIEEAKRKIEEIEKARK